MKVLQLSKASDIPQALLVELSTKYGATDADEITIRYNGDIYAVRPLPQIASLYVKNSHASLVLRRPTPQSSAVLALLPMWATKETDIMHLTNLAAYAWIECRHWEHEGRELIFCNGGLQYSSGISLMGDTLWPYARELLDRATELAKPFSSGNALPSAA